MVLGHSDASSWKEVSRQYRKYLFVHGSRVVLCCRRSALGFANTFVVWTRLFVSLPIKTFVCLRTRSLASRDAHSNLVFFHFSSYLGLLPKYMRNNVAITVTYLVKSVPI